MVRGEREGVALGRPDREPNRLHDRRQPRADVARSIVGTDRNKVVISDRFPSYDGIERHEYCWSHLRRDFQAMIDRQDEGSAVGTELLGSSDRLFHWWHKYRDGEMAWSTFLGYTRPIRWGVRQALGRGVSCASEKTAAMCRQQGRNVLEYLTGCFRVHVTCGPLPSRLASNPGIDLL